MDIIRSLGEFNIDDYIGDPSDDYKPTYNRLNQLRNINKSELYNAIEENSPFKKED